MAKIHIKEVTRSVIWCPPFGGERLQARCEGCPFYKGIDTENLTMECTHPSLKKRKKQTKEGAKNGESENKDGDQVAGKLP